MLLSLYSSEPKNLYSMLTAQHILALAPVPSLKLQLTSVAVPVSGSEIACVTMILS